MKTVAAGRPALIKKIGFGKRYLKYAVMDGTRRIAETPNLRGAVLAARAYGFDTKCYEPAEKPRKGCAEMIDPTPNENASIEAAGQMAGEYLESIGKTDLATLGRDEWLTFIGCVIDGYRIELSKLYARDQSRLKSLSPDGQPPAVRTGRPRPPFGKAHFIEAEMPF